MKVEGADDAIFDEEVAEGVFCPFEAGPAVVEDGGHDRRERTKHGNREEFCSFEPYEAFSAEFGDTALGQFEIYFTCEFPSAADGEIVAFGDCGPREFGDVEFTV